MTQSKTRAYYRTWGGGCRRLLLSRGRIAEYPYFARSAIRCKQPGSHPHRAKKMSQNDELRGMVIGRHALGRHAH